MKAYSQDLRERVIRACDARRGTRTQIAQFFQVSTAWIRRLLQRRRETGSIAALPHAGGPKPKMDDERRNRLLVLVTEQPDATLAELRERWGAPVHLTTVARVLLKFNLTVKKKSCMPPSKRGPMSGDSGRRSVPARRRLPRSGSCSSMKAAPIPP